MHKKKSCFIPPKGPLINQINMENEWSSLCDLLDGNNSIVEHLHKFSNQNAQTKICYQHVCTEFCENWRVFKSWYEMVDATMKAGLIWTSYNISFLPSPPKKKTKKKKNIDIHAKFALGGYHWLESTPSRKLLTQQKHDNFPILNFLFHIPLISKLYGSRFHG